MALIQTLDLTSTEPGVKVSPEAAAQMKKLLSKQDDPEMGVRLGVRGGGCAGLNYDIRLDTARPGRDRVWEVEGVKIIVDPKSLMFLAGSTVEYSSDLLMGGFRFENPNAAKSCGCGTSFSV